MCTFGALSLELKSRTELLLKKHVVEITYHQQVGCQVHRKKGEVVFFGATLCLDVR